MRATRRAHEVALARGLAIQGMNREIRHLRVNRQFKRQLPSRRP